MESILRILMTVAGEAAVRAVVDIGPKVAIFIAGRTRIPDGIVDGVLTEIENVAFLSFTQQLRDYAAFASANGLRFELWVPATTQLSGPLAREVASRAITLGCGSFATASRRNLKTAINLPSSCCVLKEPHPLHLGRFHDQEDHGCRADRQAQR
jgi:Restriction endonuclease fold toxin 7